MTDLQLTRRQFLVAATSCASSATVRAAPPPDAVIMPEQFGARGDGRTNDTDAFAAMATHVNARGGGHIVLRRTTYIVGRQDENADAAYAYEPAKILEFIGCTRPVLLRGNSARLRCANQLRYGTFDRATGSATHHQMPNTGRAAAAELATPYRSMIRVEGCRDVVDISDLELDGNVGGLLIGGQYGDVGWQIPAVGIQLVNNSGTERLSRIHCHHHALDGLIIDGADRRSTMSTIDEVRCEYNGRQGCSIVGGRNYSFSRCNFSHTGKALISSPPGAGVDIEAEGGKHVTGLRFIECEFSNNKSAGLLADSGPSDRASFERCSFIGTTGWAAWPKKPHFKFLGCSFVGAIAHAFGDPAPERACQFHECTFRDDPALTPTGEVYGEDPARTIANLPHNPNVLFNRCQFLLTHDSVLPWTTNVVTFADCALSQQSNKQSYPRGTFVGRNVISGNVGLYSARIKGEVILNGKRVVT